jgi:hypothetical protein
MSNQNIIYISKRCQHSKKLLITIYKNPSLKSMFKIVAVENTPPPPFIKSVPTLLDGSNNRLISGNDLFSLIDSYSKDSVEHEEQQITSEINRNEPVKKEEEEEEELAPWNIGEMGGGISSCYSMLDSETPFQNSFELIDGDGSGSGPGANDATQNADNSGDKSDKRKLFDNDYENFIKNRNNGIPMSNNRA